MFYTKRNASAGMEFTKTGEFSIHTIYQANKSREQRRINFR